MSGNRIIRLPMSVAWRASASGISRGFTGRSTGPRHPGSSTACWTTQSLRYAALSTTCWTTSRASPTGCQQGHDAARAWPQRVAPDGWGRRGEQGRANNELELTNGPSTGCTACGAAARHHTPGLHGARLQLNSGCSPDQLRRPPDEVGAVGYRGLAARLWRRSSRLSRAPGGLWSGHGSRRPRARNKALPERPGKVVVTSRWESCRGSGQPPAPYRVLQHARQREC